VCGEDGVILLRLENHVVIFTNTQASCCAECVRVCVFARRAGVYVTCVSMDPGRSVSSSLLFIAVTGSCLTARESTLGSTRKLDAAGGGSGGPARGTGTAPGIDIVVPGVAAQVGFESKI